MRASLAADLFAKSAGLRDAGRDYRNAWKNSALPGGFRHELLSLQLVEHIELLTGIAPDVDRDLVLHLVACHHGHCRPFAPVVVEDDQGEARAKSFPAVDLTPLGIKCTVRSDERCEWTPPHRLDSGIPERFWRLVRRYGWWGLAWLEAVFILADHRLSEDESRLE